MDTRTVAKNAITPHLYCALKPTPVRSFDANVSFNRARFIINNGKYWVNGTVLKYHFLTDHGIQSDVGDAELNLVRAAFQVWKDVGLGISFEETAIADAAEIRIGFVRGIGAWSYIGRDCLLPPKSEQTMNFGWNLLTDPRTVGVAIHEIGHAIGLSHEHQNPNAGIVWNEPEVLKYFSAPPNNWNVETIRTNILNKLLPGDVKDSKWDPASIMEYSFPGKLIAAPEPYNKNGINPPGDQLSTEDKIWITKFYPALTIHDYTALAEAVSMPITLKNGEQGNFQFKPKQTRQFDIRMFGESDAVLVVFETTNGTDKKYIIGQDDSGTDKNVAVKLRLEKDKSYLIKVRMLYANPDSAMALMIW